MELVFLFSFFAFVLIQLSKNIDNILTGKLRLSLFIKKKDILVFGDIRGLFNIPEYRLLKGSVSIDDLVNLFLVLNRIESLSKSVLKADFLGRKC